MTNRYQLYPCITIRFAGLFLNVVCPISYCTKLIVRININNDHIHKNFCFYIKLLGELTFQLLEAVVQRCSVRKDLLKNFAKFTRKHLCQSLFFNEVASLRTYDVILTVLIKIYITEQNITQTKNNNMYVCCYLIVLAKKY